MNNTKKSLKDFHILIVDDNPFNVMLLNAYLEELGFRDIQVLNNGQQAIDYFCENEKKIDIIFMDLQMPVMNGIEATAMIRAKAVGRTLPIIAVTAYSEKYILTNDIADLFDKILIKPIRLNHVENAVEEAFVKYQLGSLSESEPENEKK